MTEQRTRPPSGAATQQPPTEPAAGSTASPGAPLPPHLTMGLLDRVAATALDADYPAAARRRQEQAEAAGSADEGPTPNRSQRARTGTAGVLLAFALLITVAAVQTARSRPTDEAERESLRQQVTDRRTDLRSARSQVAGLRRDVEELRTEQLSGSQQGRALQEQLTTLGASVGTEPVSGPGMVVSVDDAPGARNDRERVLDGDLQRLVNGLWLAGAEAIAINNHRLTQLSAIRTAGEAITVNNRSLRPPYSVQAIGNPDQMPARFIETRGGAWWLNLRSVYKVRFEMSSKEQLALPAMRIDSLRVARLQEAPQ